MTRAREPRMRVEGLQPAQVLTAILGLLFLAYGILGFVKSGFGDFTGHHDADLWRFSANPLNNLVHVVTGVIGLLLAFGSGRARTFGWVLLIGYGVLFVWGLVLTGTITTNPVSGLGNPLDLRTADTWLHLGIAVVGLLIAVLPARRRVRLPEDDQPQHVADPSAAGQPMAGPSGGSTSAAGSPTAGPTAAGPPAADAPAAGRSAARPPAADPPTADLPAADPSATGRHGRGLAH
ncbi:DUF4383 domain-containing protein [Amycolatopsis jiangsuensis]|uniref:DUF4383 domain-containing protein n=1 Tax=Amycolatopsis jiangsuensis TaxID=1181879 RepID=A0A840IVT8_9PSEU|nr:DUF4383 domain-containing protein [Amycolatopsis jiangsuensis]MBB4686861.1 hypothetical protein [Amycolatopsis jiangsuensis]